MKGELLNVLFLKNISIFQQLQLEEALIRVDRENWCLINEGSSPAIVMGISEKEEAVIDFEKLQKTPIPVIRRFSGGGTVVVDAHTLFVTMICKRNVVQIPAFPTQILHWNGALYNNALKHVSFKIQGQDYTIGNKKFGGNAQYITKEKWLHHSVLLWDYDPELMGLLKIPLKAPDYREGRSHDAFLMPLSCVLKDKQAFLQEIISSLGVFFGLHYPSFADASKVLVQPHRQSTTLCQ